MEDVKIKPGILSKEQIQVVNHVITFLNSPECNNNIHTRKCSTKTKVPPYLIHGGWGGMPFEPQIPSDAGPLSKPWNIIKTKNVAEFHSSQ